MSPLKFIPLAKAMAAMSKDPSTKVGSIILDDDGNVLATGFNGFPRGVNDDPGRYADRAIKYKLASHAESNAIAQAARNGVRVHGGTLIVTSLFPCSSCAKMIIQAGIKRVLAPRQDVAPSTPRTEATWVEEAEWSSLMFGEAGVIVEYY